MLTDHFEHLALTADVLVAGGGPAGVSAAIGAARQGARVILMQDRPVLGGNASSEVRMHILGANSHRRGEDGVIETRETGLIEEIRLENAFRNPQRSASMFDQILYEKCIAEPNLTLYLDTRVTGARTEGGLIAEAEALCASTEQRFTVRAKVFIDCTGDCGLGVAANAAFMKGREDRAAYGESLGRETADTKTLGSTLLLMGRKHDKPMRFIPPAWARKFTEDDLKLRKHASHGAADYGLEYGFWWVEWGGHLDTIKDNAKIRHELLAIVLGVWDHIKNDSDHGADCWALDWFGAVPGKRESRRLRGQYVLSEGDLLESRPHFDAIAYGGWPIDIHPPEGVDLPDEPPCTQQRLPYLYDIPLRCCVSENRPNLMFAGRNLSATHVAFASTRIMATCSTVGEAVGIAAAYAARHDLLPADLAANPEAISEIQQRILQQDLFLIGRPYCGGREDYALKARLSASSEQGATAATGAAAAVLTGVTRSVTGSTGVPSERELAGVHRWMSRAETAPWLELRWEEPIPAERLTVIWDSGLHRPLTLSHSHGIHTQLVWGTGQPELARSYRIEVMAAGSDDWTPCLAVEENWQRRVVHPLPKEEGGIRAVRIHIDSTWGLDHARIVQVMVH